jgi:hypothetical protein
MGKSPDFLIVVALITEQNIDNFGIALDQERGDLVSCFRVDVTCGSRITFTFASIAITPLVSTSGRLRGRSIQSKSKIFFEVIPLVVISVLAAIDKIYRLVS